MLTNTDPRTSRQALVLTDGNPIAAVEDDYGVSNRARNITTFPWTSFAPTFFYKPWQHLSPKCERRASNSERILCPDWRRSDASDEVEYLGMQRVVEDGC